MFPKMGKTVPKSRSKGDETDTYAKGVGAALNRELGNSRHATKTVMRWTNASERSVKNWLTARKGPRGDNLVDLIRNSDEVLRELLRLSGRHEAETLGELAGLREILSNAACRIDTAISKVVAEVDVGGPAGFATGGASRTSTKKFEALSVSDSEQTAVFEFDVLKLDTREKAIRAFGASSSRA